MSGVIAGKTVVVLGDDVAGATVGRGLAKRGANVSRHVSEAREAIDLVVIPVVDPGGLAAAPLARMSDAEWVRRCEAPLDWVRAALTEARSALIARGGRVILLVSTLALAGAEDFVAASALGEGARLLAKAAARAWGAHGITVNCLALTPEQLAPGETGQVTQTRLAPPLKPPDLENDVAGYIAALLLGPPVVTGSTTVLDGGAYMTTT
jgi:NAD(P)-dependent dehydrogenase (short-subunit alcohol dehydrogenase family)